MAITVVGTPTDNRGASTAPAITLPAGIEADDYILLTLVTTDETAPSAEPSGYTEICAILSGGPVSPMLSKHYYKKADGTEDSSTPTWTTASTEWITGQLVLRGVDTTTPFDVTVAHASHHLSGTNDNTPQTPGLTTVTDGAFLIEITSLTDVAGNVTAISGDAGGATEWINEHGGATLAAFATYEEIATAQAVTGAIHTYTDGLSGDDWHSMIYAMRPAAGSGNPWYHYHQQQIAGGV